MQGSASFAHTRLSMTILVSPHVAAAFQSQIAAQAGPPVLQTSSLEAPLAPAHIDQLAVAYLSLDVLRTARGGAGPHAFGHFASVLRAAPRLAWVHTGIAGADHPLYGELMDRGVQVTTSSGANADAVAHTAIAGILALARNVPQWLATQNERGWLPLDGALTPRDLPGQHLVIVGMGPIGLRVAEIARALGMTVSGVRRQAEVREGFEEVVGFNDFDRVVAKADWLVLTCPLTSLTARLVGRDVFDRLPTGARLINVGRGGVVDETALLDALSSGRLAGAYSDVFDTEPLPADSPLRDAPNLIISSHTAGRTSGSEGRATQIFLDNLHRWGRAEPLVNLVVRPAHSTSGA